ncbi:MAG: flagellar hook-associated protein FlgL [Alphaproteobacteria bacterium]|nr:flagellar hook-associated protein FlgL [Alphaproteobacteria bacterium]
MQVSTKIFNDQALAKFTDINKEIQDTQTKISTGKNILRASEAPVAAVNISVAKEQKTLLTQYQKNIDHVKTRLEFSEIAITDMQNIMTRMLELTILAKNDTNNSSDRDSIAKEVESMKVMLVALANSKDTNGDAIFAGYKSDIDPFVSDNNGTVSFVGNQGVSKLQISETQMANNSINGADTFMRIKTDAGYKDLFSIVDDLKNNIQTISSHATIIDDMKATINHLSVEQTEIGSQIYISNLQYDTLEKRKLMVTENLSKLEDADLAEMVTKLQTLLVTRDASQQSFSLIGQRSLFDYIK